MMTNPVASLNAMNAAYNWMSVANARLGLLSFAGSGVSSSALLNADKNYEPDMLNDSFMYQAYSAMADTQARITKDNIKRSFSIFA